MRGTGTDVRHVGAARILRGERRVHNHRHVSEVRFGGQRDFEALPVCVSLVGVVFKQQRAALFREE
eukprot:3934422-Rhodomonas_salina.2